MSGRDVAGEALAVGAYTDELAGDTRAAIGRLNTAWGWLHEARIPGPGGPRPTRPPRPVDPDEQAGLAARYRYERAGQLDAIKNGAKPVGEHALPIAAAVVEARVRVSADVAALARRMWEAAHDEGGLILSIRSRELTRVCPWCHGAGYALEPEDWPGWWPLEAIPCALCAGRMVVATGQACQACGHDGPCACDRSDVVLALALAVVDELLDVAGVESMADACDTIEKAARRAERAAGAGHDRRALPGDPPPECPVCGSRELDAEVSHPDRRRWSVTCRNPECLCEGPARVENGRKQPACPCGIATERRRGRAHSWPGSLWDGPHGLARLFGLTGPGTETLEAYRWRLMLDEAYAEHARREALLNPKTERRRRRARR